MTGELILFEGKEVRTFEIDGEIWMPLLDLALAWGLDRTSLIKHVERRTDFFEGCTRDVDNLSTGVPDPCINEEGLYLLIARVSLKKIKNPAAKVSIIRFRKMAPKILQGYRRKEIVQIAPSRDLDGEISYARMLAEKTKGDPKAFLKIALGKFGAGDYAPALDAAPVIIRGESGWYNPSQLVAMCNDPQLNAERLNYFLANNPKDPERRPFQYRDENRLWRLTPLGMEHGREYQYRAVGGHIEPRIEWRESILHASGLKRPVDEHQLALPARA